MLVSEIKLVMLCYVMLCYVMLCYVMLCYVMKVLKVNKSAKSRNAYNLFG